MDFLANDSIIACSTGSQNTAIGVIRLSGPFLLKDINGHFSINLNKCIPRQIYHCKIINNKEIIDDIIFTFFQSPQSYTGENVVELSVHGNQLNIEKIINVLSSSGLFRRAFPGEFTYRALRNKKISLSQVEGLDLFLNATNSLMLNQGQSLLGGKLQEEFEEIHQAYLELASAVELQIDFSEDVGESEAKKILKEKYQNLKQFVLKLYERVEKFSENLLSPDVVLFGQTNAGKSTLFNHFLGENRAITSQIEGTTRDFISELVHIEGYSFRVIDTAGIRDSHEDVELQGIGRSFSLSKKAFFKILVINPFMELSKTVVEWLKNGGFDLCVLTHCDKNLFEEKASLVYQLNSVGPFVSVGLPGPIGASENIGPIGARESSGPIGASESTGPIGAQESIGPIGPDGDNSSKLKGIEAYIIHHFQKAIESDPILVRRHRDMIKKIYFLLVEIEKIVFVEEDMAIVSSEISRIGSGIEGLLGLICPEMVLNTLFSNFCIGK